MNLYKNIINAGVYVHNNEIINDKIKTTNFIAIILSLLAVPFTIIAFFLTPSIFFIPALFMVIAIVCVLLNFTGAFNFSRYIISITLMPVYLAYVICFTPLQASFPNAWMALFTIYLPTPFLVFGLEERKGLIVSYTIVALLFFGGPYLLDLENIELSKETLHLLENGFVSQLCYVTTFVAHLGSILYFRYSNSQSQEKNLQLLQIMNEKTEKLQENEHALHSTLKEVEIAREEDRKRQWESEGLSKLSEMFRIQNTNSEDIYDNVINYLVRYLNANQAGLYLLEHRHDNKPYLNLTSLYAYNRKKYDKKEIEIGEGFVGQAFLEKEYVHLTEIPQNYLRITSGLGDANPTNILIIPLKLDDKVYGVLEMASFKSFESYQINYLVKACENLASLSNNIKVNNKTKELLVQSSSQTEELKQKEEEMRQNMEELQSIQEEMKRKENQYILRIKELENQLSI